MQHFRRMVTWGTLSDLAENHAITLRLHGLAAAQVAAPGQNYDTRASRRQILRWRLLSSTIPALAGSEHRELRGLLTNEGGEDLNDGGFVRWSSPHDPL